MNVKVMLWYDVEDYITPEADDALDGLIDMMDRRGVRSSLKFVAEKARVLRNRGRFDILGKLAGHEICYHTDNHSRHPTMTEYLETYGFADGAEEFLRLEDKGLRDVMDITGQFATSYGQPGASWGSQVFPVLRRWGIPSYLDSHDVIDVNGKPFWYGGILNLTRLNATMRMNLREAADLDTAKKQFDEICVEADAEQTLLISIYYHPCEFSCVEFWDGVNYARGQNTPRSEWKPARLRKPGEMQELIERLGQFIDYTLTKENVEYNTAGQALQYEIRNNAIPRREQIEAFAQGVGSGVNFADIGGNWYAPSELLSMMVNVLRGKHLSPALLYGPEKAEESHVDGTLLVGELVEAFEKQTGRVFGYKQLPDLYRIDSCVINPVDLFCTLAAAVAKGLCISDRINLIRGELVTAGYVKDDAEWGSQTKWVIFPWELPVPNTIRMAKNQTWTLKPARY